eukprot:SAG31_NODE_652_length_13181_cov_14.268155_4_plen_297_part_00
MGHAGPVACRCYARRGASAPLGGGQGTYHEREEGRVVLALAHDRADPCQGCVAQQGGGVVRWFIPCLVDGAHALAGVVRGVVCPVLVKEGGVAHDKAAVQARDVKVSVAPVGLHVVEQLPEHPRGVAVRVSQPVDERVLPELWVAGGGGGARRVHPHAPARLGAVHLIVVHKLPTHDGCSARAADRGVDEEVGHVGACSHNILDRERHRLHGAQSEILVVGQEHDDILLCAWRGLGQWTRALLGGRGRLFRHGDGAEQRQGGSHGPHLERRASGETRDPYLRRIKTHTAGHRAAVY